MTTTTTNGRSRAHRGGCEISTAQRGVGHSMFVRDCKGSYAGLLLVRRISNQTQAALRLALSYFGPLARPSCASDTSSTVRSKRPALVFTRHEYVAPPSGTPTSLNTRQSKPPLCCVAESFERLSSSRAGSFRRTGASGPCHHPSRGSPKWHCLWRSSAWQPWHGLPCSLLP